MAEVRLRLLWGSARFRLVEDVIPVVNTQKAVLSSFCMTPVVYDRETAACTSKCHHRKRTLLPFTRSQCMRLVDHIPQIATQGLRFYSQGNGSKESRNRQNGQNNGALESDKPLHTTRTGYYDILEVTSHATQSQIKTAYYKQSFRFHPDRNDGNVAATRRFGQVTEAYHVLGSSSLRKKYDRGILSLEDVRTSRKPSGKTGSQSRKEAAGQRHASSASSSSTPTKTMFDFDAFYQAHYGEQLAREQRWKERREELKKESEKKRLEKELNMMHDLPFLILILPAILILLSFKE